MTRIATQLGAHFIRHTERGWREMETIERVLSWA